MSPTNSNSSSGSRRFDTHVELKGSARKVPPGKKIGAVNSNEIIEVTIRLRRKNAIEDYVSKMGNGNANQTLTREEFGKKFGASDKDIALMEEFAREHDLTIVDVSVDRRTVRLKGTVQNLSQAFLVKLANYQHDNGKIFR